MRSAYIIAGIAISPLLKMNGEVAIAMTCAAFCIPNPITIVRLTESVSFSACKSKELQIIAEIYVLSNICLNE